MEPLAVAAMVMIGTALFTAAAMGAVGGVITVMLKSDLAWGALTVVGAYLATLPLLGIRATSFVGLFPLILAFLVASLTSRQLQASIGLRPTLAALAGIVSALGVSFLSARLIRFDSWLFVGPKGAWTALGVILFLIIMSLRKWKRIPNGRSRT